MLGNLWAWARWFLGELVQQFVQRDCLSRAASLTYTTLFAVVPFMTVTYIILSTFSDLSVVGESIKSFIFTNFCAGEFQGSAGAANAFFRAGSGSDFIQRSIFVRHFVFNDCYD